MSVHNGTTDETTVSVGKGIAYDWLSLVVLSDADFDAELAALIELEGAN